MSALRPVKGLAGNTTRLFRWKLVRVAGLLGVVPDYLATAIAFETGGTFNPAELNRAGSGAVGLIQFMPDTAIGLGTTTAELATMSADDQLDFVYAYFRPHAGKLHSLADVYLAIFYPAAIGHAASDVIARADNTVTAPGPLVVNMTPAREAKVYAQNAAFDREKKGYITVSDVVARIEAVYNAATGPPIDVPDEPPGDSTPPGGAPVS